MASSSSPRGRARATRMPWARRKSPQNCPPGSWAMSRTPRGVRSPTSIRKPDARHRRVKHRNRPWASPGFTRVAKRKSARKPFEKGGNPTSTTSKRRQGHPAALGLKVELARSETKGTIPILLYPKLRSDGDYGLTVGSEFTGTLLGAELSFCSYGVKPWNTGVHAIPECKSAVKGSSPSSTTRPSAPNSRQPR